MNPHAGLSYKESARIIIGHVEEGIKIAHKYNLPEQIIAFIRTHHGTGVARYFYNSDKNEHPDEEIDIADFSYPGPNPFSRETAIVMMADTLEAASHSLQEYTEASISDLVERLIDAQLNDGLLKNTPITFKDIETAKTVFKEKLITIYHTRIAYPRLKNND
jgi:membrane-associated HD superfamily phosphohydrolase